MRWLYYIPHDWEGRTTQCWEDLYLMPDIYGFKESIWLTVDGYFPEDTEINGMPWKATWFDEGEFQTFFEKGFLIRSETCDMIIPLEFFTKEELLYWAKRFIEEEGYKCTELVEAPAERFAGSNQHACAVEQAADMMEEYKKDPEGYSVSIDELLGEKDNGNL